MRERKKGFTLIELLAVIVILAVIALIATPIVLNLINTARKGAFTRSAEGVLKGANLYYSNSLLQLNELKDINFTCDNKECISDKVDENNNLIKLDVDGSMGKGNITIKSDGNILFTLTDDKYCAVKYENNSRVQLVDGNCSNIDLTNDTTAPDIYSVTTVVTTNSIRVSVGAEDNESGIYGYEYSIDGGENYTDIIRNNTYIFEGLKNDKTYEVKVRVYNGTYGKDTYSDEKGRNEKEFDNNPISLKTIETPEFTILPKGWSLEKEVTIDYKGALIQEYSIDNEQTYVEYTNLFKITENIDIIAKASDGQNEVKITANIRTIDRENPTVEVSDINTSYDKKDEITLTLNDNLSGVTHYCVTSENTSDNCNWISGSGTITHTINTNGTYYAYSKDLVGNISEAQEFVIDKIDTEAPTASLELESKTTNSITVKAVCTDNVGVTKYEYSYDNGVTYETGENDTYTFSGLTTGTYNIKVKCSDEAGNVSNEANVTVNTEELGIPSFSVSPSGEVWAPSKTVTITYTDTKYINEYIVINGSATKEDGTVLENNKPYPANSSMETVIFTSDGNIVARTSDGTNTVSVASGTVSMIDTVEPIDMTLSANSDTTYEKTKSVTVTLKDTGGSGLAAGSVKYGWSTSDTTEPSSYTPVSTSATSGTNTTTFKASGSGLSGSYYLWVVPTNYKDNAGNSNTTTVKSTGTFKFDNAGPTVSADVSTAWTNSNKTITVSATDSHVGTISGYYIGTSTTSPTSSSTWQTENTFSKGAGTYYIWAKDSLGNISSKYATVTVSNIETTAPTLSVAVTSGTTYAKSRSATVTLKDTGGSGLAAGTYTIKYGWGTSAVACSSMTSSINITTSAGASSATETITISSGSGAGSIYICNSAAIKDVAGNSLAASTTKSVSMYLDNTAPTSVTLSANSDTTYSKTKSVTVTLKDTGGSGLAAGSIKYGWSTSTSTAPSSYTPVSTSATSGTNTTTITASGSGLTGSYYLWVVPVTYKDNAGNSNTTIVKSTGTFKFDNTVPTLTLGTVSTTKDTITVPYTVSDSHSGINTTTCVYGTSTSYGNTGTISDCVSSALNNSQSCSCVMSGLSSSQKYYYKITTTDKAGNSTFETGNSTTASAGSTLTVTHSTGPAIDVSIKVNNSAIYDEAIANSKSFSINPGSTVTLSFSSRSTGQSCGPYNYLTVYSDLYKINISGATYTLSDGIYSFTMPTTTVNVSFETTGTCRS